MRSDDEPMTWATTETSSLQFTAVVVVVVVVLRHSLSLSWIMVSVFFLRPRGFGGVGGREEGVTWEGLETASNSCGGKEGVGRGRGGLNGFTGKSSV